MDKIKFGVDGWWGTIAKDFTLSNVTKMAYAVARWMTNKYQDSSAVLGYDCRFGGEMFMNAIAKILASKGIQVYIPESFVSSPMVSLGVLKLKAQCGMIVTACNSPAKYNGIKLKASYGGPMQMKDIRDIEALIANDYDFDLEMLNWNYLVEQGRIQYVNLESIYQKNIRDHFDIEKLQTSGYKFVFDPMHGSAQKVFDKLLIDVETMHSQLNPSFDGLTPNPDPNNLHELAEMLWGKHEIDCALAVDGDGDRMAMFDNKGQFLDSNHLMLLLIHYLAKYQEGQGKVVASYAATSKVDKLCAHYGLELERTPIGFDSIAAVCLKEEVLVAGTHSGELCLGNYLPESDGVWTGLTIWEMIIESQKGLAQLMEEVIGITGDFYFEKFELDYNKNSRNKILDKCEKEEFVEFQEYLVTRFDKLDGYKYFFSDEEWVLIRPSSFYPVLRMYVEAKTKEKVRDIASAVQETLKALI